MRRAVFLTFLAFGSVTACSDTSTAGGLIDERTNVGNRYDALQYIQPVLETSGRVARIYYSNDCQSAGRLGIPFPRVNVQPARRGTTGAEALRSVFRNDNNVSITFDNRIVRIRIGKISDEILRTTISKLVLTPTDQYNSVLAIAAIENTKEVQREMRKLGMPARLPIPSDMLLAQPDPAKPHLSASIENVSMDQALDRVAVALNGVVFYGTCIWPHFSFEVSFNGIDSAAR